SLRLTKPCCVLPIPTNSSCASRAFVPPPTPPAKKWNARCKNSSAPAPAAKATQRRTRTLPESRRKNRHVCGTPMDTVLIVLPHRVDLGLPSLDGASKRLLRLLVFPQGQSG